MKKETGQIGPVSERHFYHMKQKTTAHFWAVDEYFYFLREAKYERIQRHAKRDVELHLPDHINYSRLYNCIVKPKSLKILNDYSHEIKSPLARIKALVELVRNSKKDESIVDKLERIDSSADSVNFKIETVFTYLNLSNYPAARETFDLSKILEGLAKKYKMDMANIETYEICGDPILTRKMLNLLLELIFVDGGEKLQMEIIHRNSTYNLTIGFDKNKNGNDLFKDELPWILINDIASRIGIKIKTNNAKERQTVEIAIRERD